MKKIKAFIIFGLIAAGIVIFLLVGKLYYGAKIDPATRTFLVKVALPPLEGLYPGMFGKLLVPVQEHEVVLIPWSAVRRVGQLELVAVKDNENWRTRYIKTGKSTGTGVEVLAGLVGGEIIGID